MIRASVHGPKRAANLLATRDDACEGTYGLMKEKGKAGGPKREKGTGARVDSAEISLDHATARAHRTHGTTRNGFPVGLPPPTFDIYIYIYIYILYSANIACEKGFLLIIK